ncbi:MAG: energy-coupling factor transporter transmembrane protein EcfT [Clostridia bacterium]|nr:energy-coupling factor transporter transmembrane protein EcfT [Clostridia bacterium]
MKALEAYHPAVSAVYFLAVAGIAMFCMNPILQALSLFGALLLFLSNSRNRSVSSHAGFLLLFLLFALLNPLFSHNGATVLFVLNNNPVTLESAVYGLVAAGMILAVLYWFRSFTQIMTSDKLLYLFGKLSPKLSLILSMGLRYVPLFQSQVKKIRATQTALGLYKEDNLIDRVRGELRVFSITVTWALENGITTADSMEARGYGIGKRSHFSLFRFRLRDGIFLAITLVLFGLACVSICTGALEFTCYPTLQWAAASPTGAVGYLAYGGLVLMPAVLETEERIKWKYLRSSI